MAEYEGLEEAHVLSAVGLRFIGSKDSLVRRQARNLLERGSTELYHRGRRAATGEVRQILERLRAGTTDVWWDVEELAHRFALSLEAANRAYPVGASYLRGETTLECARQELARQLHIDAVTCAVQLIQMGVRLP